MANNGTGIPESWAQPSLEDVCEILDSMRIPVNNSERSRRIDGKRNDELYPYYGATGQVGVIDDFIFDGEHVLLGEDGAPFLDPFKDKAYLVSDKFWVNNHAHILNSAISNKYLSCFLNQIDYSQHVTGTTRLKLTQAALKRIPIHFAPEAEQHRIVAKIEELLSEMDKGVENLKTAREQLKVCRQAVLDSAATGQLLVQRGYSSSPFGDDELTTLEDVVDELGQGWSPRCLNHPSPDDEFWGVIKTTAIQHLAFNESENKQLPEHLEPRPHLSIKTGDILVTRAGPRKRVGVTCLVRSCRPRIMLCDKAYRLRSNLRNILPEYLEMILNSPRTLSDVEKLKTGISDSGVNLTQQQFLSLQIFAPSIDEQKQTLAELNNVLSNVNNAEAQIEDALQREASLRHSILKKAVSGRLVEQDPNDEPASVLLERIKAEKATKGKVNNKKRKDAA